MTEDHFDVIVVGAGAAGLRAAVAACEAGAKTCVVTKRGGASSLGLVGLNAVIVGGKAGDTTARFLTDTWAGGAFLADPRLVQLLADRSTPELGVLRRCGVDLTEDGDTSAVRQAAGNSLPRTVYHDDQIGPNLMRAFRRRLTDLGGEVRVGIQVVDLLEDANGVCGIVGVEERSGNLVEMPAGAVILATGGLGHAYAFTTNPPAISGDGYMLAARAGAVLTDLEFMQWEPFILVYPEDLAEFSVPTTILWDGARIYNGQGQEFLPKDANGRVRPLTKDIISRHIAMEISEGRGTKHGGVFFDMRDIPGQVLEKYPRFLKRLLADGVDPKSMPVEVAPAQHYMNGGILIDTDARTTKAGLWACGEAAGGVHGASRLAGNGGTDDLVFGGIAGRDAAEWAQDRGLDTERRWVTQPLRPTQGLPKRGQTAELRTLGMRIRDVMWESVGIIRTEASLQEAVRELQDIRDQIAQVRPASAAELPGICRVQNGATLAWMIARSALERKESRGDHFRADYQERDDAHWWGSQVWERHGGAYGRQFVPVCSQYQGLFSTWGRK